MQPDFRIQPDGNPPRIPGIVPRAEELPFSIAPGYRVRTIGRRQRHSVHQNRTPLPMQGIDGRENRQLIVAQEPWISVNFRCQDQLSAERLVY